MAVGEAKKQVRSGNIISQVSWTDGTTQDVYYGLEHSFQYSRNINADDEMHGIKLSTKAEHVEYFPHCQLVSCGSNGVMALDVKTASTPKIFTPTNFSTGGTAKSDAGKPNSNVNVCPGVVFQDYFWYGADYQNVASLIRVSNTGAGTAQVFQPCDHTDYTDEAISTVETKLPMTGSVSAILNYNNSRLVVAVGGGHNASEIWVYYPELDQGIAAGDTYAGRTGWKKVLTYEAGTNIVALTCTFEYLKVRAVDEGWNTKVYYYQGNNNLRSTFVYNVVDLTGVRVTRVYSINGIDYYVSSQDGTDGFVNLYKMVGTTPVSLFHQRSGLHPLDVNYKSPYFVGPCSIGAGYSDGTFYIADAYGLFKFTYTPQGYDNGYMKWGLEDNVQPYGVCFNQGYLYVSYETGCYKMRVFDTGKDGYQEQGVLISREFEGREGGTVTKMLDEIRMNYELNPNTDYNGTIDVYVSPNNLRKNTHTFTQANNWYKVMHIEQKNGKTRTEKSNLLNDLGTNSSSSFKFDWQTITYAIVITRYTKPGSVTSETDPRSIAEHATPIVRQIDIKYHCKDKVNNVYDIN